MPKTWKQKLEGGKPPHVETTTKPFIGIPAGAKMLISCPTEFKEFVDAIPARSSVSVSELKQALAKRHGAEYVCPLTTGIFLRIISEAALDEMEAGKAVEEVTPFWRVITPEDSAAKKIRCGPEFIAARRAAEGL